MGTLAATIYSKKNLKKDYHKIREDTTIKILAIHINNINE